MSLKTSASKQTKEEKQLLSLCQLWANLRDIKRQEQGKVQQVSVKKNVKVDDDTSSSIEKAMKLLQQQEEEAKIAGTKKRTPASLRAREGSPPSKRARPTLPSPAISTPSPSRHEPPPPYRGGQGQGRPGGNCQIFVGDLNPHLPPEEHQRLLGDCFSKYGTILSLRILTGKNCGFIFFENQADAEAAIDGMNRQPLGGSTIRVSWGKERFGGNRRF
eukprot:CAMPEP_0201515878 /NCGR_PEP_ID=MMETSP0161_2-20130828/7331_1 /ASSEMBLY_ACC=CAM_ASM_000251 /TAXON_ID=180227 /ORGANISM="Neoparamoeba aestuarina, Strain SoJaBio B1-5/56/2" /LENGTH=216 /DNA_ID=CAMNT_0047912821 /DNA_START=239 /DNA_END=889 /DNA_ORIENTATION=+